MSPDLLVIVLVLLLFCGGLPLCLIFIEAIESGFGLWNEREADI